MSDSHGDRRDLRAVIARVSETPALARAVRQLPPVVLHGVMQSVGLGTREVGLEAIISRLKRHARDAVTARAP